MLSRRKILQAGAMLGTPGNASSRPAGTIELELQTRDSAGSPHTALEHVDPKKVAIICVDAWHYYWCRTWRNRAGSLIPRFNHSFDGARKLGMTLVFSPTNAMRDLNESPQRRNTLALPNHLLPALKNLPDPYPGALRWGMCECGLGDDCHYTNNVNNQHPDLRMAEGEFIALTQQEAYNILKQRGITHIIYTGFATNMCMWGKPTGMKYMRQFGFACTFARDLTEAITRYAEESFNPTRGTLEVIELMERELAPSINMEQTLQRAGAWEGSPVLDHVHIAPWGRFFGSPVFPIPVQVELTCRHQPGARLRYTLDGSEPDAGSTLYTKPIKIDRTTTLKTAGFREGRRVTRTSTATYWKFPPVPPPPDVFISDLEPVRQSAGDIKPHSYAVRKFPRLNRSADGNILSNRDSKFAKGIGVQAPAELVFQIEPRHKRFVSLVGIDDECMRWDNPDGLKQWPQWSQPIHSPTSYRISQVVFKVLADGRMLAESPPLFNGDKPWSFDLAIPAGAKLIQLVAEDVDSRITDPHGHGDWLSAGFITVERIESMKNGLESTRRRFISSSAGAVASSLAAPSIVSAASLGRGATAPSDRVTVGIIGSGGRAVFETRQYPSFDNAVIVAVCDAQENRRVSAKAALEKQYAERRPGSPNRGIRMYHDFRELLAQKDIDAVYIASPDHWHVSMLIPALKAGKHVHCEKPLGVSIEQDLAALKAARKYKKVFQYGAELRAFPDARKGIELVLNGRIGKVQKIYVVGPPSATGGSATPVIPVPPGFDYDLWLGPAPVKPFCADRCLQGSNGRNAIYYVSDYTLGNIANWAAHPLDQVQRWADAVGRKDPPVLYEGSGKFPDEGLFDTAWQWNVRCSWPDGLVMHFVDSNTYHEIPDAPHPGVSWGKDASGADVTKMPNGAVFAGTEGWVVVNYGKVATHPASLMESEIGPNDIHLQDSALASIPEGLPKGFQQTLTAGHHQNWIRAIRTGSPVVDGIESAFRSDMVSQLSELCIRSGQTVRWDPKKETIVGNEAARKMIKRPMRAPWGVA